MSLNLHNGTKNMHKFFYQLCLLAVLALVLSSCGKPEEPVKETKETIETAPEPEKELTTPEPEIKEPVVHGRVWGTGAGRITGVRYGRFTTDRDPASVSRQ